MPLGRTLGVCVLSEYFLESLPRVTWRAGEGSRGTRRGGAGDARATTRPTGEGRPRTTRLPRS